MNSLPHFFSLQDDQNTQAIDYKLKKENKNMKHINYGVYPIYYISRLNLSESELLFLFFSFFFSFFVAAYIPV